MGKTKKREKMPKRNKKELIFYCILLAWPVAQFCVFYIGVNFNSLLMSFQNIRYAEVGSGTGTIVSYTIDNYRNALRWFAGPEFRQLLSVSLKSYLITLCCSMPLGLLFAYYIFKKLPGWGSFRVILFLPMILSGVVMAAVFRYFVDVCLPRMVEGIWFGAILDREIEPGSVDSLLSNFGNTSFGTLMFYNVWVGFGTSVLMYSNKMAGISDEIIESAHLDGATGIKEFWYIVLPLTYPTISVFLITGIAQICVNQYGVYDMYAGTLSDNRLKNIGYWLFADVTSKFNYGQGLPQLPYYAAIGVILTLITAPVTLGAKWAMEKFGPSEE